MKLYIQNAAETIELDRDFKPRFTAYTRRKAFKPKYGQDGSIQTGDGRVSSRQISISYYGKVEYPTDYDESSDGPLVPLLDDSYREKVEILNCFFRPDLAPFYLIDQDNSIRTQIEMASNLDSPFSDGLELRIGANMMNLEMMSGHWEDSTEQTETDSELISGDTFEVNNTSRLEAYPVFELTALEEISLVTLTNNTNGKSVSLSSAAFLTGSVLTIDPYGNDGEGSLSINDIDVSTALEDNSGFISLDPGINEILYEATGRCSIVVRWRRRFTI